MMWSFMGLAVLVGVGVVWWWSWALAVMSARREAAEVAAYMEAYEWEA